MDVILTAKNWMQYSEGYVATTVLLLSQNSPRSNPRASKISQFFVRTCPQTSLESFWNLSHSFPGIWGQPQTQLVLYAYACVCPHQTSIVITPCEYLGFRLDTQSQPLHAWLEYTHLDYLEYWYSMHELITSTLPNMERVYHCIQ